MYVEQQFEIKDVQDIAQRAQDKYFELALPVIENLSNTLPQFS